MNFTAYRFTDHYLAIVHPSLLADWLAALATKGVDASTCDDVYVLPHPQDAVEQLCHGYKLSDTPAARAVILDFISRTYG
jgi:type II secretory pathway component PulL